MTFELSPFGIAVPDWLIPTTTIVLWLCLVGVVLRCARGTET